MKYIDSINKEDNTFNIKSISQVEYKHFNNNKIFVLPQEITLIPDDVEYINLSILKDYDNADTCFNYFKKYVIKNAYNKNIDDNTLIFLFNQYIYTVEKEPSKHYISPKQKLYEIQYKLTLI